jgi:hypothetical protein
MRLKSSISTALAGLFSSSSSCLHNSLSASPRFGYRIRIFFPMPAFREVGRSIPHPATIRNAPFERVKRRLCRQRRMADRSAKSLSEASLMEKSGSEGVTPRRHEVLKECFVSVVLEEEFFSHGGTRIEHGIDHPRLVLSHDTNRILQDSLQSPDNVGKRGPNPCLIRVNPWLKTLLRMNSLCSP